jgi:hypothetical protein
MQQKFLPGRFILVITLLLGLSACAELDKLRQQLDSRQGLSQAEIGDGLKEALRVGSNTVVSQLGRHNGFNHDRVAHIGLPDNLDKVRNALKKIGYSQELDRLETRLNRAAEQATPKARALFINAIRQLTWQDVKQIYNGPDDAATRYFQASMSPSLRKEMQPVISQALAEVGVIQSYESVMAKYRSLPFVPDVRADLTDYTIDKSLSAIFYYLAREEAAIRKDPAKRTTQLLRRVFGTT